MNKESNSLHGRQLVHLVDEWPGRERLISLQLDMLVDEFVAYVKPDADEEWSSYANEPDLDSVVSRAAFAKARDGKRHSHQRRLKLAALGQSYESLSQCDFKGLSTFHDLFEVVRSAISPIVGIGELMVYDTAVRIGAWLGLEPEFVYLHSGTRLGAAALGLSASGEYLRTEDIPSSFQKLKPREVEDFLCIFKDRLNQRMGTLGMPRDNPPT